MAKKIYIDTNELEEYWYGWMLTKDDIIWKEMANMIYKICEGVSTKFCPSSPDEYNEHVHDAYVQVMEKIKNGKLRFTHGRAPVFNLLTTTIFRILYSKMNKQKRQRKHHAVYSYNTIVRLQPDLLHTLQQNQV